MSTPAAPVVGIRTNGHHVDQVRVHCCYCGGVHVHAWHDEPDGLRTPTCGATASYRISIDTRVRMGAHAF